MSIESQQPEMLGADTTSKRETRDPMDRDFTALVGRLASSLAELQTAEDTGTLGKNIPVRVIQAARRLEPAVRVVITDEMMLNASGAAHLPGSVKITDYMMKRAEKRHQQFVSRNSIEPDS